MHLERSPKLGITLAMIGGFIISADIPVIRLAGGDPWIFMLFRGMGLAIILGAILRFAPKWTNTPYPAFADKDFLLVGCLYGASGIFFTFSVFATSTAHLVFILAFNPLIAAILSWKLIGERPSTTTWIAIIITLVGVFIIVNDGLASGHILGDITAFVTACLLAFSVVKARQSGKDMSLSGTMGGMISALFALPIVLLHSTLPTAPGWLLLNAFIMAPAGAFALSLAPRYIPAPQVAMFFLLETVLAPIWVWLIFSEIPSQQSMVGGSMILLAISLHSYHELRKSKIMSSGSNPKNHIQAEM